MRPRPGPSTLGSHRGLSRRQDSPTEPTCRAGAAGSQSAAALSRFQAHPGVHQRTESVRRAPGPRTIESPGARVVIATRRRQRTFADGFIAETVEDLWEPWMRHADVALDDDAFLSIIQQELAKRCKKSKTRGRKATPVEVVLRMLLLKHVRDWSFEVLSREVRANLGYREFTRIGGEKVPDDRTMGNLARQLGPEVIEKLHRRVVEIAQENKIATGRKMRVDTTVVETDIHYPTDSSLLGDGVRVLRASEVGNLKLSHWREKSGRLYIERLKGSLTSEPLLSPAENRALKS